MSQLRLFKITADELESKAMLSATLTLEIIGYDSQIKDAQVALRESSEYLEVKDLKAQKKDAIDRLARVHADLRAAARDI